MQFSAAQIAAIINATTEGDYSLIVDSFGKIEEAREGQLSFLANPKYEDYLYSLSPEIANRRSIKRPFNEQELLYLFYSMVRTATVLEAKGQGLADVNPEKIMVNDDGYVKFIHHLSLPQHFHSQSNIDAKEKRFIGTDSMIQLQKNGKNA